MAIDSGFHAVTKADLREDLLQAEAERDRLRKFVEGVAGGDCHQYVAHLRQQPCGTCETCMARKALAEAAQAQAREA